MLRATATRSLLKSFTKAPVARSSYTAASAKFRNPVPAPQLTIRRPQVLKSLARPATSAFYATNPNGPPWDKIDTKAEEEIGKQRMKPDPEHVTGGSSVRHVFEESQAPKHQEEDMMAGIKADIKTIQETFTLSHVPKEALYIGGAGLLPYAATSLSTVWLSYDINHAHANGNGIMFSPETAHQLLDFVTPIQIGYGAVIISFLGAIHWGMEFAGYGGSHGYRRYMIGVAAPAIAWPTIFFPYETALITQFLAFNFLYFTDARATVRGWFPEWYSIYRFVLTFIVGASIVASLIGRGRIVHADAGLKSPFDYIKGDRDQQWEALELEEKERRAAMVEKDESEDEEGSEDGDGDEKEEKEEEEENEEKEEKEEKGDEGDEKKAKKAKKSKKDNDDDDE